jgi:hypothetical protein
MATPIKITEQDTRVDYEVTSTPDDTFDIPFQFFETSDVRVSVGGVEQTSGFTVTGTSVQGGFSDGTLTLDSAVSDTTVSIWRDVPLSRTSVFPTSGEFSISSLNTQLARLVAMLQERVQTFKRAFRLPEAEGGTIPELPDAAARAGKILSFDSDGNLAPTAVAVGDLNDTINTAKNWAQQTGSAVDGSEYSAKEYALGNLTATGGSAKAWAQDASAPDGGSAKSAKTLAGEAATSETNAASSASAAATSETNAANSASAAATSETNAESALDTFQGQYYGGLSSDPSQDPNGDPPDAGDLYFNTTANEMRHYDGAVWSPVTGESAVLKTYRYTATAGQTSFSGADADGKTLSYADSRIEVFLNGVRLIPGVDYTANNGSSVVLSDGAAEDDELSALVIEGFTPNDVVPASTGGTFSGAVQFSAGVTLGSGGDNLGVYEEGTWTPVLEGGTTTGSNSYLVQYGRYTRIGSIVFVDMVLVLDGTSGALDSTGSLQISGLPYSVTNTRGFSFGTVPADYSGLLLGDDLVLVVGTVNNSNRLRLRRADQLEIKNIDETEASDSLTVRVSLFYQV